MLQWPWRKIATLERQNKSLEAEVVNISELNYALEVKLSDIEVKKEFVPIAPGYTKQYKDLWNDHSYLTEVSRLKDVKCLTSESVELLSKMRNAADRAQTPEELCGVNACIKLAKNFLTISDKARYQLELKKASEVKEDRTHASA